MTARDREKASVTTRTRAPGIVCPLVRVTDLTERSQPRAEIPAVELKFTTGQVVYRAGQPATHLYEVKSGMLIVSKDLWDGRRQVVEIAPQGWVCGFSDHGEYDASCEALSPASVLAYKRSDFNTLNLNPDHERLAQQVEGQICVMHEHALSLGQKTAKERLAALLVRFLPNRGGRNCVGPQEPSDGASVCIEMTREQIADYLGLGLEAVSRAITDLQQQGLIARGKNKREILIKDVCGVCRLAHTGLGL